MRVDRAVHEFKAFRRVELSAGQTKTVQLEIDRRRLGYWDVKEHRFVFVPGKYRFEAGDSSRNLPASFEMMLGDNANQLRTPQTEELRVSESIASGLR
ncbi:MAG: hypothetical protein HIU93_14665 [Acidobacteria bacterium]|nr:hypothetical protein [Acidobacteriota bacterium]